MSNFFDVKSMRGAAGAMQILQKQQQLLIETEQKKKQQQEQLQKREHQLALEQQQKQKQQQQQQQRLDEDAAQEKNQNQNQQKQKKQEPQQQLHQQQSSQNSGTMMMKAREEEKEEEEKTNEKDVSRFPSYLEWSAENLALLLEHHGTSSSSSSSNGTPVFVLPLSESQTRHHPQVGVCLENESIEAKRPDEDEMNMRANTSSSSSSSSASSGTLSMIDAGRFFSRIAIIFGHTPYVMISPWLDEDPGTRLVVARFVMQLLSSPRHRIVTHRAREFVSQTFTQFGSGADLLSVENGFGAEIIDLAICNKLLLHAQPPSNSINQTMQLDQYASLSRMARSLFPPSLVSLSPSTSASASSSEATTTALSSSASSRNSSYIQLHDTLSSLFSHLEIFCQGGVTDLIVNVNNTAKGSGGGGGPRNNPNNQNNYNNNDEDEDENENNNNNNNPLPLQDQNTNTNNNNSNNNEDALAAAAALAARNEYQLVERLQARVRARNIRIAKLRDFYPICQIFLFRLVAQHQLSACESKDLIQCAQLTTRAELYCALMHHHGLNVDDRLLKQTTQDMQNELRSHIDRLEIARRCLAQFLNKNANNNNNNNNNQQGEEQQQQEQQTEEAFWVGFAKLLHVESSRRSSSSSALPPLDFSDFTQEEKETINKMNFDDLTPFEIQKILQQQETAGGEKRVVQNQNQNQQQQDVAAAAAASAASGNGGEMDVENEKKLKMKKMLYLRFARQRYEEMQQAALDNWISQGLSKWNSYEVALRDHCIPVLQSCLRQLQNHQHQNQQQEQNQNQNQQQPKNTSSSSSSSSGLISYETVETLMDYIEQERSNKTTNNTGSSSYSARRCVELLAKTRELENACKILFPLAFSNLQQQQQQQQQQEKKTTTSATPVDYACSLIFLICTSQLRLFILTAHRNSVTDLKNHISKPRVNSLLEEIQKDIKRNRHYRNEKKKNSKKHKQQQPLFLQQQEVSPAQIEHEEFLLGVREVHCEHISALDVATNRIIAKEPSIQTLPGASKSKIRACIIAPILSSSNSNEALLVSFDYSEFEMRVLAHLSGDNTLVQTYRQGKSVLDSISQDVVQALFPSSSSENQNQNQQQQQQQSKSSKVAGRKKKSTQQRQQQQQQQQNQDEEEQHHQEGEEDMKEVLITVRGVVKQLVYSITYGSTTANLHNALRAVNPELSLRLLSQRTTQQQTEDSQLVHRALAKHFPSLDRWRREIIESTEASKSIKTVSGFQRSIQPRQAWTQAVNSLVQGTAADILKMAIHQVHHHHHHASSSAQNNQDGSLQQQQQQQQQQQRQRNFSLLIPVHDELLFAVDNSNSEIRDSTIRSISHAMEQAGNALVNERTRNYNNNNNNKNDFSVPLPVKVKVGRNLFEMNSWNPSSSSASS